MSGLLMNIFGILSLVSSIKVVSSEDDVESVLYLVLVFCNVCGVLILCGLDFIGLMLIMVYVGAVAVLFLFIVMMMGGANRRGGGNRIFWVIGLIIVGMVVVRGVYGDEMGEELTGVMDRKRNIEGVGEVLFTDGLYKVLVGGGILLVAMIGGVTLSVL